MNELNNKKQCSICEEWFPATTEYFYKNKSNKTDGLHPYCKGCTKIKSHKWQEENREEYLRKLRDRQNENSKREEVKIRKRESVRKLRKEGYFKEYYKNNPDRFENYRFNHLHKQHYISINEWINCKNFFDNSCAYCGISEEEAKEKQGQYLHKEHAINNGANDLSNCIPSCKICNSLKNDKDYNVWYNQSNEYFTDERMNRILDWLSKEYLKHLDS